MWLFIFAAGFRQVLGVSIIPPYETYVLYEVYIAPGLIAMIQLFNGMQSSLTMVYDRETGGMRTLLVSPFPRWWLLTSKLLAGTLVSVLQVYAFLVIAWFWEIEPPPIGYLTLLPALLLSGFMLGALGMLISSLIKQLENFAGVMNFVIFPMFFASSALYPLWRVKESSPAVVLFLRAQSIHARDRADSFCAVRPGGVGFAWRRVRMYGCISVRCDPGLRPGPRLPGAPRRRPAGLKPAIPSLRANGSGECPPDDRLREAIQSSFDSWIASSLRSSQ